MGPLRHLAEWRSSSSWEDRPAGSDTREWRGARGTIQEIAWKPQDRTYAYTVTSPKALGPSKHAAVSPCIHFVCTCIYNPSQVTGDCGASPTYAELYEEPDSVGTGAPRLSPPPHSTLTRPSSACTSPGKSSR